jgi:hypothetical protein
MEPEKDADFRALENTLRRFGPAPLSGPLQRRLVTTTQAPAPWADRILAAWSATGAIAACLVAALTVWQFATTPAPPAPTAQEIVQQRQTLLEYQQLIASR